MVRAAEAISEPLEEAILGHHERLDGSGYPRGIRGTHLSISARLAGIVDTYDALLQHKSYSPAFAAHDAIRLVNSMRDRQFDSALVKCFVQALGVYPTGSWVQLADGRLGIVRSQTAGQPARPQVALVCDSTGGALKADTMLWQPSRRGDIARAVLPGQMQLSQRIVDAAVSGRGKPCRLIEVSCLSAIELYSFAACPYAQRTHITLLEKKLDFEIIEIDLFNRPEWFSTISPYGKVPVLRHADVTVHESSIINQYLDEAFPQPALMPESPALRAQVRIWMDYCETRFLPALHKLMSEAGDTGRLTANNAKLAEVLRHIEHEGLRKNGSGPWFFGTQFSLADIQFAPFLERFDMYVQLAGAALA